VFWVDSLIPCVLYEMRASTRNCYSHIKSFIKMCLLFCLPRSPWVFTLLLTPPPKWVGESNGDVLKGCSS